MASKQKIGQLRSNFTLGNVMAESDPLLLGAYYDNGDFEALASHLDPRCFIIGRTGSGKSAALRQLEASTPGRTIRIIPENLSLPYLTNLDVIRRLVDLGVHLEPFLHALWKHVILVEIIKHRYNVNSPEQKQNILTTLKEKFKRDTGKTHALKYFEEFGERFWCETDERVREITDKFSRKIQAEEKLDAGLELAGVHGMVGGSTEIERSQDQEVKRELAARYQKVVNDTQLPRLNQMIEILGSEILDSRQHFTYILIDDLDKEWVDSRFSNLLIRCLFDAVIDLKKVENLKVLIALRTNIFRQLDYAQRARGTQEEKIRGLSLEIRWREDDLRSLLNSRSGAACRLYGIDPPRDLGSLFPRPNKTAGDPIKYLIDRTLMRPRDAILFANECLREASGRTVVSWKNIIAGERRYSEERLSALRDEWKDPYVDIHRVFEVFQGCPALMTKAEFTTKLEDVALLTGDRQFKGAAWLNPLCERLWWEQQCTWFEYYGPLVSLLYTISFIGVSRGPHGTAEYSYTKPDRATRPEDFDDKTYLAIHPAFRSALGAIGPNTTA